MDVKRFKVVDTPWVNHLPKGTVVITVDGQWFEREDGERLFPVGVDRAYDRRLQFKMFESEIEPIYERKEG